MENNDINLNPEVPNIEPEQELPKKKKFILPLIILTLVVAAFIAGYFYLNSRTNKELEIFQSARNGEELLEIARKEAYKTTFDDIVCHDLPCYIENINNLTNNEVVVCSSEESSIINELIIDNSNRKIITETKINNGKIISLVEGDVTYRWNTTMDYTDYYYLSYEDYLRDIKSNLNLENIMCTVSEKNSRVMNIMEGFSLDNFPPVSE